jgi:predicted N-formylglutamate amidohydrolase
MIRRMPRPAAVIVTCEHASNRVPAALVAALRLSRTRLGSHEALDLGAAAVARTLARTLDAPLVLGRISRLVVDLNRSPGNRNRWSDASRVLPAEVRQQLIQRYHRPHWDAVHGLVAAERDAGRRVIHVGVHSFTPTRRGVERPMDVAFLYDPARAFEVAVVRAWRTALRRAAPDLVVHRNAPYRGVDDGLTRALRRRFADRDYAGIELELNQRRLRRGRFPPELVRVILLSLREVLQHRG